MVISGLEIIDSAVKIGLGAILAGLSGIAIARLNHDREAMKAREGRRRELLEKVAENVEIFSHAWLRHWALVIESVRFMTRGKEMPQDRREFGEQTRRDAFEAAKFLSTAEAHLLLLGEEKAQQLLREYGEEANEMFRKMAIGVTGVTEDGLLEYREKMLTDRQRFYNALSAAYSRNHINLSSLRPVTKEVASPRSAH